MKGPISYPQTAIRCNKMQMAILRRSLSEDLHESHNFIILNICDVTSRCDHGLTTVKGLAGWLPYQMISRENEGTEREAPGPALGICHVHESYF